MNKRKQIKGNPFGPLSGLPYCGDEKKTQMKKCFRYNLIRQNKKKLTNLFILKILFNHQNQNLKGDRMTKFRLMSKFKPKDRISMNLQVFQNKLIFHLANLQQNQIIICRNFKREKLLLIQMMKKITKAIFG